jgi:hypothetical protein
VAALPGFAFALLGLLIVVFVQIGRAQVDTAVNTGEILQVVIGQKPIATATAQPVARAAFVSTTPAPSSAARGQAGQDTRSARPSSQDFLNLEEALAKEIAGEVSAQKHSPLGQLWNWPRAFASH